VGCVESGKINKKVNINSGLPGTVEVPYITERLTPVKKGCHHSVGGGTVTVCKKKNGIKVPVMQVNFK
jgi:hypothetical protein